MSFSEYIYIARPSHWMKNMFVLPGTVIAAIFTGTHFGEFSFSFIIGLVSVCLVASSNYVINEWLDAEFDRFHPVKKHRPSVTGNLKAHFVYIEYALLALLGLFLASMVSTYFFITSISLLVMGFFYNVKPFRTKDKVYLDVLSESVNNPLRLMMGWFIVTSEVLPPSSLLFGYWMGGAFLMNVKRYSELRFIKNPEAAGLYRRSFRFYTEDKLMILSNFYGMCSAFFTGVFLVKYRIELLLSLPFLAVLFAWYLKLGMMPDSPAQHPELLYKEKGFALFVAGLAALVGSLLLFDIPVLHWFLQSAFISEQ